MKDIVKTLINEIRDFKLSCVLTNDLLNNCNMEFSDNWVLKKFSIAGVGSGKYWENTLQRIFEKSTGYVKMLLIHFDGSSTVVKVNDGKITIKHL